MEQKNIKKRKAHLSLVISLMMLCNLVLGSIASADVTYLEKNAKNKPLDLNFKPNATYQVKVDIKKPDDGYYSSFMGSFKSEAIIKTNDVNQKTLELLFYSGYNWQANKNYFFTDLSVYTTTGGAIAIDDLSFEPLNQLDGYVTIKGKSSFTLPYIDERGLYKGQATLDDGSKADLTITLDWQSLKEVLPKLQTPQFTPKAGKITEPIAVSITNTTAGAIVYYTIDGSTPSKDNGKLYNEPFIIKNDAKVKAIAIKEGMADSDIASVEYIWSGDELPLLGDVEAFDYVQKSDYQQLVLHTIDETYYNIMQSKTSLPRANQYYVELSQGELKERHLYNGGIGGFTVKSTEKGSDLRLLLEKDKWDITLPLTVNVICSGYQKKYLQLDLTTKKIVAQADFNDIVGDGDSLKISQMEAGKTYTGKFTAYRIDNQTTESMLSGFFERSVKISLDKMGKTTASFRNVIMADAMLDLAIQKSDQKTWKSAVLDGRRFPKEDISGATIATVYEVPIDLPTHPLIGAVNVKAMGGSESNIGDYDSYTQVYLKFEEEVKEGFTGFESEQTGYTAAKTKNRFLMTIPGLDIDDDGYVSSQEIEQFSDYPIIKGKKTLNMKLSDISGKFYSLYDEDEISDISWLKLVDKSVQVIDFRGQNITAINDEFKGFAELEKLVLAANNITTIEDNAFSDLGKLEHLAISTNLLNHITSNTFNGLVGLKDSLDLSQNRIKQIDAGAFSDMDIRSIYLYDNFLKTLNVNIFDGLDKLESINAEGNEITEIPAGLNQLKKLNSLSLSGNKIDSIDDRLDKLAKGITIDLRNNMIKALPASVIDSNDLSDIKLENNCIEAVPENLVKKALESSWRFNSVFTKNAIDITKCKFNTLTAEELATVKEKIADGGLQKNILNFNMTAADKKITFNQELAAFDYLLWNMTKGWVSNEIKEAVKKVLDKTDIANKEEYNKFRMANLKSFSQDDMKNSILCSSTGTIKDFAIETTLEKREGGIWQTIDKMYDVQVSDVTHGQFVDRTMKKGDVYRLTKKLSQDGNFDFYVTAYATVEKNIDPNGIDDSDIIDITKNGKYKVPVRLWHETKNQPSMGDAAFKNNRMAYITTQNGLYYIEVATNPIYIDDMTAGIGVILSKDGKMDNIKTQSTSLPSSGEYISKFSFESRLLPDYFMISITAPGSPMQGYFNGRLYFDWEDAERTDGKLKPNTKSSKGSVSKETLLDTTEKNIAVVKVNEKVSPFRIGELIKAKKDLKIESDIGSALLDQKAMKAIKEQIQTDFKIEMFKAPKETLNQAQQKAVGDRPFFEIKLTTGDKEVTDFKEGTVTIELNYMLKPSEKTEGLVVWHIDSLGNITPIACTYDKKQKVVRFTTNHFSLYAVGYDENQAWQNPFVDVMQDAWYYDAVSFVMKNNLMNGASADEFKPEKPMTRAMLVAVLYRMEKQPQVIISHTFTDVKQGDWYEKAVYWAVENKIVKGYGNGRFGANDQLTREQLALMMYRYANYKGHDTATTTKVSLYVDSVSVADYAKDAMAWTIDSGILKGVSEIKIAPKQITTRVQVATVIMRYLESF